MPGPKSAVMTISSEKPSEPSGILVSIIVANHAAAGVLGGVEYVWALLAVTLGLSFLMVSTIRFRSFKDIKLNARTVLLVTLGDLRVGFTGARPDEGDEPADDGPAQQQVHEEHAAGAVGLTAHQRDDGRDEIAGHKR